MEGKNQQKKFRREKRERHDTLEREREREREKRDS